MTRSLALLIICMPALSAGMQSSEPGANVPFTGINGTYELAGPDPVNLTLDSTGTVRITVRNLGRDTILTIRDAEGGRILRAAGWRGPEHYYIAVVDLDGPVSLVFEPDDPISPPGQFHVQVDRVSSTDPSLVAERAMTTATDRNLAFYYGESDTRSEAREQFLLAASLFLRANDRKRQADALFEAANVSRAMCNQSLALEQLESAAEIWSEEGDERSLSVSENQRGLIHWERGENSIAKPLFESAATRRKKLQKSDLPDAYFYAEAINNLGLVHREMGDAQLAAQYFEQALQIWQGSVNLLEADPDNPEWPDADQLPWLHHALTAMNNVGWATEMFGDVKETERIWNHALLLSRYRQFGDMEARLQNNLGHLKRRTGNMSEALELLENSLAYFTETSPNEFWASGVYFNIGRVHKDLGDSSRALNAFEHSLELRSPDCDPVGRAESLHEIAAIGLEAGQVDQTLKHISEAELLLDPFAGNYSTRAALLNLSGRAYLARHQFDIALARHDEAFRVYRSVGDRQGELDSRIDRASVNAALGNQEAAIGDLKAAIEVANEIDARLDHFRALTLLSEIYLAQKDVDNAQRFAAEAVEHSEDVRRRLVRPVLLRDFFAVQRAAYDVLVEAHLIRDDIEQAWRIADETRARRFRDIIRRTGLDLRSLTPEQQQRYQFLVQAIAARAETRTAFLSGGKTRSADLVLGALIPLLDEMDFLQEQARRSTIDSEMNVNLKSVQSQIKQEEKILEYFVGPNVTGFWSIDERRIAFHSVPQGDRLEEDIDVILKSIRQQLPPSKSILEKLSRNLLGSSEFASTAKSHLIVVPDGPLHYLPFAILPDPISDNDDPLIARWDVTYSPSVGALIELRSRPPSEAKGIAIMADPVFQPDDPRIHRAQDAREPMQVAFLDRDLRRGAERIGIADFPRLPRSLDEANAVRDAAGGSNVLTLHGTDANRDVVLAGDLNHYKILHFATHGILDSEEPALSGLVLSGVTANGAPRSRFLRSQDIAGLDLDAQLVVLSGCETGLGRLVSGEGLLGLTRAFFYAGANQVISTLWQVPDRATAELMRHFYSAYLQDGNPVPDALRRAQLEIRSKPEWSNPFYWGAFIVQGD